MEHTVTYSDLHLLRIKFQRSRGGIGHIHHCWISHSHHRSQETRVGASNHKDGAIASGARYCAIPRQLSAADQLCRVGQRLLRSHRLGFQSKTQDAGNGRNGYNIFIMDRINHIGLDYTHHYTPIWSCMCGFLVVPKYVYKYTYS